MKTFKNFTSPQVKIKKNKISTCVIKLYENLCRCYSNRLGQDSRIRVAEEKKNIISGLYTRNDMYGMFFFANTQKNFRG